MNTGRVTAQEGKRTPEKSWTEFVDTTLEGTRVEPPESGCLDQILEVPSVSVEP